VLVEFARLLDGKCRRIDTFWAILFSCSNNSIYFCFYVIWWWLSIADYRRHIAKQTIAVDFIFSVVQGIKSEE